MFNQCVRLLKWKLLFVPIMVMVVAGYHLGILNLNLQLPWNDPNFCPLVSPLIGERINVSKTTNASLTEIEENYGPLLSAGGRYHPPDCRSNSKVAIIIPYRNRSEHLVLFLQHMHPFLQRQQLDYGIYIVNQSDDSPFNRATLMNIGAVEALKQDKDTQCFIFHDVDLVPEDDRNSYSCPKHPRHMSAAVSSLNYKLLSDESFGGVTALSKEDFFKVNGFSNRFWGWGGEDNDLFSRVKFHNLTFFRGPPNIDRYTMLSHKKAEPNPHRWTNYYKGKQFFQTSGLNNLDYQLMEVNLKPLYTEIRATFPFDPSMTKP